jgi:hypothetical protein
MSMSESDRPDVDQTPRVLVERDGWRLVLTRRDPERWPGLYGNIVVERADTDALGVEYWRSEGTTTVCAMHTPAALAEANARLLVPALVEAQAEIARLLGAEAVARTRAEVAERERDEAWAKRDALRENDLRIEAIVAQRDAAEAERDKAVMARDRAKADLHSARAERNTLRAQLATRRTDPNETQNELAWRKRAWVEHGCPMGVLYSDGGERQCSACGVDFLRDEPGRIIRQIGKRRATQEAELIALRMRVLTGEEEKS